MADDTLRNIFYNIKSAGFFGTPRKVQQQLNKVDRKKFTKQKIAEWIAEQDVATLHKQHKIDAIDALWELDLCNMVSFAASNDGYKYILTVIDVFSKYAFAQPVKNKSAQEIFNAFRKITTESGRTPKAIQSDLGTEFKNSLFKKYCYAKNIKQHYPQTQSLYKCGVIERFNRTLKELLFKYFTTKGPTYRRYIDILQDAIEHYNNTIHSTIKMRPAQVKASHTVEIYNNIKKSHGNKQMMEKNVLNINDYVRVIRKKKPLEHAYTEKWSRETFQISQVINKQPYRMYKLKDLNGTEISGKFYIDQLQKIKVAKGRALKIIKSRGLGPTLEHYIQTADNQHLWISHKNYLKIKI